MKDMRESTIYSGWEFPSYQVTDREKNFPRRIKIKIVDIGEKITFHGKL